MNEINVYREVWWNTIQSRKKSFLVVMVVFLFLFMIVALLTSGTQGLLIDENVAYWAEQITSPIMNSLMSFASIIGSSEVILMVTVIIGIVLLIRRNWRNFFFFFTVSVGGVVLNFALKMFIQRSRPGDEVSHIEAFNYSLELQSYSFPSGHTMRATILFLFLIYISYRFIKNIAFRYLTYIVYVGLLISVALSRIILDAHYTTDIVGALLISISWFFLCLYFFYKPKQSTYSMFI